MIRAGTNVFHRDTYSINHLYSLARNAAGIDRRPGIYYDTIIVNIERLQKAGFVTQNIIFDVDGTLWDTTEVVAKAWNRAIQEVGLNTPVSSSILKKEFGKTMNVIADDLFSGISADQRRQLLEKCCIYEHEAVENNTKNLLYPHVRETLKELSEKCRLFIVSNCQSGYIELFMKKVGVEKYITDIECYGNTGKGKGDNIRLLIERNHLKDAAYVGDTQGDREATAEAGIPFVFARYGFGSVEDYAFVIDDFGELLNFDN